MDAGRLSIVICALILSASVTTNSQAQYFVTQPFNYGGQGFVQAPVDAYGGNVRPGRLIYDNSVPSTGYVQPSRRPRQFQNANVVRTTNFVVSANSQQLAQEVAQTAEAFRRDLAVHWLGKELPAWPQPCPLRAIAAANLPASGETTYQIGGGYVGDFRMTVRGTTERILDSVLPHEITHTVFATHFGPTGKPVPRWADEGACSTVEHLAERSKHDHHLVRFLTTSRGLPFSEMFALREYPADPMPLYAQGYSVVSFLIAQGGPRKFVQFLEAGLRHDDWVNAVRESYDYPTIGKLQTAWNEWVGAGGGDVANFTPVAMGYVPANLAANPTISNTPAGQPSRSVASNEPVRLAALTATPSATPHRATAEDLQWQTNVAAGNVTQAAHLTDLRQTAAPIQPANNRNRNFVNSDFENSASGIGSTTYRPGSIKNAGSLQGALAKLQQRVPNAKADQTRVNSINSQVASSATNNSEIIQRSAAHPQPTQSVGSQPMNYAAGSFNGMRY